MLAWVAAHAAGRPLQGVVAPGPGEAPRMAQDVRHAPREPTDGARVPPRGMPGMRGPMGGMGGGMGEMGGGMGAPMPGMGRGGGRPSLRRAFVSLRNRHFRVLWMGTMAANMAMGMEMLARGYLAFALTGSYALVGVISVSYGLPMFFFALIGGAMADRMDKRALMLATQLGTGVLALVLAVLITTGLLTVPILFGLGLLQGTVMALRMPTQMSMLPELVPEDEMMSAVAVNNASMNATRPLAPMAAGLLLAAGGVGAIYYAQAAMYAITALFVVQLPSSTIRFRHAEQRGGMASEIGGAFRYLWRDRTLLMLMVMGVLPMLFMMPMHSLLPGFAEEELGLTPEGLGLLMSVSGIGALFGSFLVATLTEYPRKGLLQLVAGLGAGASLIGLGAGSATWGYPAALAGMTALGLFQTVYMTANMTVIMTTMRPEFFGRVMAIFMMSFSFMPFMTYPMGVAADAFTASATFAAMGVATAAIMVGFAVLNPGHFRRVDVATAPGGAALAAMGRGRPKGAPAATVADPDGERPASARWQRRDS